MDERTLKSTDLCVNFTIKFNVLTSVFYYCFIYLFVLQLILYSFVPQTNSGLLQYELDQGTCCLNKIVSGCYMLIYTQAKIQIFKHYQPTACFNNIA